MSTSQHSGENVSSGESAGIPLADYGYVPILSDGDNIRIFELFPGYANSQIRGCFVPHSLQRDLRYDAVSYAWGNAGFTMPIAICCEERRLAIPVRVERILQDLRLLDLKRHLWIDAICINQDDVSERAQQVRLMRQIYARSSTVRVWIDLELDETDPGISTLASFDGESTVDSVVRETGYWDSVNMIVNHEYWQRMWVQQELSLASTVSIQCRRIPLSAITLLHYYRLTMQKLQRENTSNIRNAEVGGNQPFLQALEIWSARQTLPSQWSHTNPFSGTHAYYLIYDALERCRSFEATDPRDKIFALDGTIKSWREKPITIDYKLSVAQVYCQVARHIIDKWESLAFLCSCVLGDATPSHRLPSWLPDYSKSIPSTEDFAALKERIPTDYPFTSPPAFKEQDRLLEVQGFLVDKVFIPYRHLSFRNFLHNLRAQEVFEHIDDLVMTALALRDGAGISNLMTPSADSERDVLLLQQQSILITTILGCGLDEENEQNLLDFDAQSQFFKFTNSQGQRVQMSYSQLLRSGNGIFCKDPDDVEWRILRRLRGRVTYLSAKGVMGLAPEAVLPGDEIWQIFGCQWPLILRPRGQRHVVVGPGFHQSLIIHSEIFENFGNARDDTEQEISWENRYGNFNVMTVTLQ